MQRVLSLRRPLFDANGDRESCDLFPATLLEKGGGHFLSGGRQDWCTLLLPTSNPQFVMKFHFDLDLSSSIINLDLESHLQALSLTCVPKRSPQSPDSSSEPSSLRSISSSQERILPRLTGKTQHQHRQDGQLHRRRDPRPDGSPSERKWKPQGNLK